MQTLADILLAPQQKEDVIERCVRLIEDHVAHRGGLKGFALRSGMGLLKKARPDIMTRAVRRMLPDFATALEPLHQRYLAGTGPGRKFSAFLQQHGDEATAALLGVADRLIEQSQHPTARSTYSKFRGGAHDEVSSVLPGLAQLLGGYVDRA